MAYCTVGNIKAYYLNKTFDAGDYCSTANVEMFIDDDAAYIDSVLSVNYALPIVDADDLKLLRSLNCKLVVGIIDDIFREKKKDEEFDRTRNMRKEALSILDNIKNGILKLNTSSKGSVIKFNSIRSDGETVSKRFLDDNIDNG